MPRLLQHALIAALQYRHMLWTTEPEESPGIRGLADLRGRGGTPWASVHPLVVQGSLHPMLRPDAKALGRASRPLVTAREADAQTSQMRDLPVHCCRCWQTQGWARLRASLAP